MQLREIALTLDTTASVGFHPFEVVEGDTGNVLNITLKDSGVPILLNDCTLCVVFSSSVGFAMQDADSGVTIGTEPGVFTVLLNPDNYGPGNVSADIQVYSGPSMRVLVTSKTFDFRCRSALVSPAIIQANQAYPPLQAAARTALDAANAANQAVATLENMRGELNVQADWTETDTGSDAFILHKPYIPINPEDVGAAADEHASRHASGGADPITPAAIGCTPAAIGAARTSTTGSYTLLATSWAPTPTVTAATTLEGGTVSVDAAAFILAVSGGAGDYTFTFDGTAWLYDAAQVTLASYGLTLTGTPVSADTITVTYVSGEPYTYTLAVEGVTAASAVEVLPGLAITADQLELLQGANLQDGGQSTGSVTLKAFGAVPDGDVPVRLIVRGDL